MSNPSPFVGLLDRVEFRPIYDFEACCAGAWEVSSDGGSASCADCGKYLQRKPVASKDGLPVATHEGTLTLGPYTLHVVQLSNGRRAITEDSIKALFGEIGDGQ